MAIPFFLLVFLHELLSHLNALLPFTAMSLAHALRPPTRVTLASV